MLDSQLPFGTFPMADSRAWFRPPLASLADGELRTVPAVAQDVSSNRGLIQVGALAAIAAGALRMVGALLPIDQASAGLAVLYLVTDVGIALGLIAWYFAQHASVGVWGSVGFLLGIVGVEIIRSNGAIPGAGLYPPGALLLVVGINVVAYRAWRARRVPVWVLGLLICSAVAGPIGLVPGLGAFFVLSGLAFGIGFAGVGAVVWHDLKQRLGQEIDDRLQPSSSH